MVKITEIRCAIFEKNWPELRAQHTRAKTEGIEGCDTIEKTSTISLALIENSLFAGQSQGHVRQLSAMLDAIERGNHPYDDREALSVIEADGAIARAQLEAMLKAGRP